MFTSGFDYLPLVIFVFTTMITPGPNNITGASMGILYGFRKSLKFVLGVGAGFFFIMLLSAFISSLLLKTVPGFERIVRILGAFYILWIAYGLLRLSLADNEVDQPLIGFSKGLLLQFLNPKVMVLGMTLYSSFLASLNGNYLWIFISAAVLACLASTFTSIWTMAGSILFQQLRNPLIRRTINSMLALLLAYTAFELSGASQFLFHK